MRKRLLTLCAVAVGLFMASCSNDEMLSNTSGDEVQVTFALDVENSVHTKAISDGMGIDKLVYAVYDESGNALPVFGEGVTQKVIDGFQSGSTVRINLSKGRTYRIAFWAQNGECDAYNTADLKNVTVNYTNAPNNDESRDAFFKTEKLTVTGNATVNVVMKRPFAQLNLGVTEEDWQAAVASGKTVRTSKVTIENAATAINLLNGKVTGSERVEYKFGQIPTEKLTVRTGEGEVKEYRYLSMCYFLTGAEKSTLANLSFAFFDTEFEETIFDQGLTNVPVQRNWRTNILGNILSGIVDFAITIDPSYDGDYDMENGGDVTTNEIVPGVVLEGNTYRILSAEGLQWFSAVVNGTAKAPADAANADYYKQNNFHGKTVVLANDIDLNGVTWTPVGTGCTVKGDGLGTCFSGTFDGGNHAISNMTVKSTKAGVEYGAGLFANACGTIKNVRLVRPNVTGVTYAGGIVGYIYGKVVNCHVEGGKVTANVLNKDNGDKAGGIVGYVGEGRGTVENCSAINITVKAYRDVAGIAGCVNEEATVSGCAVDNVTVIADQLAEYTEVKEANAGEVVGRIVSPENSSVENNTANNVAVKELKSTIATAEEFAEIAAYVNEGNSLAKVTLTLANDIDLQNKPWKPMGTNGKPFSGTFDGKGHTISNLNISGNHWQGLFGYISGGAIKNLTIENATVKGNQEVGVVAGSPFTSKFENITIKGLVKVDGFAYVGAVGGKNAYADWTDITVDVEEGSYVKADSKGYRTYVGGVIGFMGEGKRLMTNLVSNIDVIGSTADAGGIVGIAHYGNTFVNCSSSGNVTITAATEVGDAREIGGIAGVWMDSASGNVTFTGCTYTGKLSTNMADADISKYSIVGESYNGSENGKLIIDGQEYTGKEWNE